MASMDLIQVLIALALGIIGYHLIRIAFKAHTLATTTTQNAVATTISHNWHVTLFIGTSSHVV